MKHKVVRETVRVDARRCIPMWRLHNRCNTDSDERETIYDIARRKY